MTNDHGSGRVLAVTWEEHRRTRELCDWLKLPLHTLGFSGPRLRRYWKLGTQTLRLLSRARPRVVYVQNPSLILALLVLAARPFCGRYRVIMDAHNEAVTPFTHAYWPVPALSRLALRAADITIVTNAALAAHVQAVGGRPQVLPDRLPTAPLQPSTPATSDGPFQVMVVATYAADEPIAEIIEAARLLGDAFQFRITGRATKLAAAQRERLPANFTQTGFLSEHDYWQLMHDSHVVLDLTLKPNCLVCGAYEALAMLRPMILTGNPATVDLFGRVAVFPTSHSAADIAAALRDAQARYAQLVGQIETEGPRFTRSWIERASGLQETISQWANAR